MLRRKTPQVLGRKGIELVHAGTWRWGDSVRIHVFELLDSLPGWISSSARALSYKWYHTQVLSPFLTTGAYDQAEPGTGGYSITAPQSIRRDVVPSDGKSQHPFSSLTMWLILGRLLRLWEGISLLQTGLFCSMTSCFGNAKETAILNFATTTKLTSPLAYYQKIPN